MPKKESAEKNSRRAEDKDSKSKLQKSKSKEKAEADGGASNREIVMAHAQNAQVPIRAGPDTKKEKKSKKRKLEEVLDEPSTKQAEPESDSLEKKLSKKKKTDTAAQAKETLDVEVEEDLESKPPKSKNSKKEKKHAKNDGDSRKANGEAHKGKPKSIEEGVSLADNAERNGATQAEESKQATNVEQQEDAHGETEQQSWNDEQGPKSRFIAFIGQLPYTATVESVAKHFEKISPASIRLPTHKSDPAKNKGFAFLEFEAYDRMKTCLKLYHRTTFDDGISPPRKIKVELTAGGGGSNAQRKDKIKYKNEKLGEERRRRAKAEAEQSFKKETKQKFAQAKGGQRQKRHKGQDRAPRVDQQLQENASTNGGLLRPEDHSGMHPDRLARIR